MGKSVLDRQFSAAAHLLALDVQEPAVEDELPPALALRQPCIVYLDQPQLRLCIMSQHTTALIERSLCWYARPTPQDSMRLSQGHRYTTQMSNCHRGNAVSSMHAFPL